MCCLRGRQAQFMCTDHPGPAPRCKHCAGSSVCSRAPRNVSAPRAASCPDNIRLTFSCHSSIPDTLNILFTSESLFQIHGTLSVSSATTNFLCNIFSPRRKHFEFDLVYLQGRTYSQKETCSFTTTNNVGSRSLPSVRRKNGFHSANINYKVWTWQHISIVLFTINVISTDIVVIKRKKPKQTNPPPNFYKDDKPLFLCKYYCRLPFAQP